MSHPALTRIINSMDDDMLTTVNRHWDEMKGLGLSSADVREQMIAYFEAFLANLKDPNKPDFAYCIECQHRQSRVIWQWIDDPNRQEDSQ